MRPCRSDPAVAAWRMGEAKHGSACESTEECAPVSLKPGGNPGGASLLWLRELRVELGRHRQAPEGPEEAGRRAGRQDAVRAR